MVIVDTAVPTARSGISGVRATYGEVLVPAMRRRHETIIGIARDRAVDLVMADLRAYGAATAADVLAVPFVSLGDGPLHLPDADTPPFGSGLPRKLGASYRRRNRVVQHATGRLLLGPAGRRYDATRQDLGLSPPDRRPLLERNLSPLLHLQVGSPRFEYPRDRLPQSVAFVGVPYPDDTGWMAPEWWGQLRRADSVTVITQGTMRPDPRELILPALEACARAGDPGLVVVTGVNDRARRRVFRHPRLPPNLVVTEFVPYGRLFPHTDLLVTNGGWNGVMLALAHGVPVVQAGATEEKPDIGARLSWSGAGVSLGRRRATVARLSRAMSDVRAEARYRAAAQGIADDLRGRDAVTMGCDLIVGAMPPR